MKILTVLLACGLSLFAADKKDDRIAELEKQVAELKLQLAGAQLRGRIERVSLPYQGAMTIFQVEIDAMNAKCGEGKVFDFTLLKCVQTETAAASEQSAQQAVQVKAETESHNKITAACKTLGRIPAPDWNGCIDVKK